MRDLTEEEIREYLDWVRDDLKAEPFNLPQTQLVGNEAVRQDLLGAAVRKINEGLKLGFKPEDVFLSFWVWAFQMGRECESRLLTRALSTRLKAR